jgi:hypothetical protein
VRHDGLDFRRLIATRPEPANERKTDAALSIEV